MDMFQGIVKGEHYEVKIENIYDPSKFWVILKFKELEIFMKYLKHIYDIPENRKSVLKSDLKKYSMFIVHKSGMYYRSIILPLLLVDHNKVRVFMIDFGYIVNIDIDDIFHIFEKHTSVPRFTVRAALAYICPTDQSKSWTQSDLQLFSQMIGKKRMFAKVCEMDAERKILFTEIYVPSGQSSSSINDMLVNLKVATYNINSTNSGNVTKPTKYVPKVKYPHLFPSFEKLESGTVPSSLWERDLVKDSVPLDLLYKDYYQYQEIN